MLFPDIILPLLVMCDRVPSECPIPLQDKEVWQPLASIIDSRCLSNSETLQRNREAWRNGLQCWTGHFPNSRKSTSATWCKDFPEQSYVCEKNLMDKFEPFMGPEEKYIADFMLSSYNYTMEQLCKDGEDSFKEIIKKADAPNCEDETGDMAINGLKKCLPKLKFIQDLKDVDVVMNKSDFCSSFRWVTDCLIDYLEEQCTDHGFSSFLKTIFDSHLHWCNNNV